MKLSCRVALVALSFALSSAALAKIGRRNRSEPTSRSAPAARPTSSRAQCSMRSRRSSARRLPENKGGAGGTLGVGEVVRAKPDGYTILANSSAQAISPFIVPNFPYDVAKDLSGVLMIGQNANVMLVLPSKGWKSMKDFIAAAKGKPGAMNFGFRRRRHRDSYLRRTAPPRGRHRSNPRALQGRCRGADRSARRPNRLLVHADLDRAAADPRRPRRAADGLDAEARSPTCRTCRRRAISASSMPKPSSGTRSSCRPTRRRYRRAIPRRRHEGSGDARDEGEAEEARGRSDADDAGGNR